MTSARWVKSRAFKVWKPPKNPHPNGDSAERVRGLAIPRAGGDAVGYAYWTTASGTQLVWVRDLYLPEVVLAVKKTAVSTLLE